jgi:D-tyrosyl-tRNA(Tyr) deacylase
MVADGVADGGVAVETGSFGAAMEVRLLNDGPVTILIESQDGAIR